MAAALRESEERHRALYDNIPLMYFRLDGAGNVLSVNEHGARELGYGHGELVGRSVLRVFHPEDRKAAEQQLRWAVDFPRRVARWELRKVRRDGSVLWVRETVRVAPGANGEPEVLVVCEDVTERRRAVSRVAEYRDQLRELNAELLRVEEREDRRIARVLHDELGQTLAAARMALCELADAGSAATAGRLEELKAHLDRSIAVTRTLTYQLSPPILHELGLTPALEALGERIEEDHGIRFVFAVGEGWTPPPAEVGVVLYRVVRELFHNVVKHARASRLRLELGGDGDRDEIIVADDGVGFDVVAARRAAAGGGSHASAGRASAGHASAGHASAGRASAGHGLGLFQVRERMERLGGRFKIESAPGRGTRALLSLTVAAGEAQLGAATDGRPGRRSP